MCSDEWSWNIKGKNGSSSFSQPIVAAPMAGAHDPPYRMVLHELGLELSWTEMISARGSHEGAKRTHTLSDWIPESGRSCAQLFGADPEYLFHAAKSIEKIGHSMIELNAGCPKKKVTRTGAGSALLNDPDNFIRCISSILDPVKIPVGTKIRSGYRSYDEKTFRQLILDLEGSGISYIAVHPRTTKQQYSGKADRKLIDKVCGWVDIPVIASGDVRGPDDIRDYLDRGASAVMFARGDLGDPSWFRRVLGTLEDKTTWEPAFPSKPDDIKEHLDLARSHLDNSCRWYGEKRGCIEFRKHLVWYVKRFKKRGPYRDKMYSIGSRENALSLIDDIEHEWCRSDQINL
ncbi:MAG: tRNA-dihydrouridine synthase [Candidatus Thermoplasmatota archaeon]|nr:tRNA-dihydrouridine synthase [Candidatus Thermoplasmatota archaeon]